MLLRFICIQYFVYTSIILCTYINFFNIYIYIYANFLVISMYIFNKLKNLNMKGIVILKYVVATLKVIMQDKIVIIIITMFSYMK